MWSLGNSASPRIFNYGDGGSFTNYRSKESKAVEGNR